MTKSKVVELMVDKKATDVSESQKELFKTIMDNVRAFSNEKSRCKIGIAAVPLSLLFVDERYQGLRTHSKLKKLISNWDERKLGWIIIRSYLNTGRQVLGNIGLLIR